MIKSVCFSALACSMMAVCAAAPPENTASIYESDVTPKPAGEIDRIVFDRLASLGIQPVLCSDAVFVRRAYLDVIGTLPTATEAREFIENPDHHHKRARLIEKLLDRDEFADYWSMKWGDVLRIKAEFPINLWPNAAQAYHRWVRASLAENKPYDQFVREMLTSSGSNFRVGPVNFYRAMQNKTPEGIATSVALTFMGARAESWPPQRLQGMAVFFAQIGYKPTAEWKEENVFWDPLGASNQPTAAAPGQADVTATLRAASDSDDVQDDTVPAKTYDLSQAAFPDGTRASLKPDQDPRDVFADWLITPENPWFTKSIANRVWAWLMGRGIIHQPDDIRDDNPPSHPQLLALLEKELIASDYDLKQLYRLILTSNTYQLSSMPPEVDPESADQPQREAHFARYPLRRLEAEVLIDAVNQITGTTDLYTSAIPEPFTYIPPDQPAIALADGSITSPFLALFGRSPRATGMESERSNDHTRSQWLHMLNSGHIQTKLERGPALRALFNSRRKPAGIAEDLYLTILSRKPTADELNSVATYMQSAAGNRSSAAVDIAWALINSPEFLYRH